MAKREQKRAQPLSFEEQLQAIEAMVRAVQVEKAENQLRALIETGLSRQELVDNNERIKTTIACFLKKRQKRLALVLAQAMLSNGSSEATKPASTDTPSTAAAADELDAERVAGEDDAEKYLTELQQWLDDLSERHIFQWASYYRDMVEGVFDDAPTLMAHLPDRVSMLSSMREMLRAHVADTFGKGYQHAVRTCAESVITPLDKAKGGLHSFLELPIQCYSSDISIIREMAPSRLLRDLCSSFLAGILVGFADVSFGDFSGHELLVDGFPRWSQYLAFLNKDDLERVIAALPTGELRTAIYYNVLPLAAAVDTLMTRDDGSPCVPAYSNYDYSRSNLEITLRVLITGQVPPYLAVHCYLDSARASLPGLQMSARRGAALVLASLDDSSSSKVDLDESLKKVVINTSVHAHKGYEAAVGRCRSILRAALTELIGPSIPDAPLEYNPARVFPLTRPDYMQYFLVHRTSVRRLLEGYERNNGVHLWCSVRRSGKTTACFDMGTTEDSQLVVQTCGRHPSPGADSFWQELRDVMDAETRLSRNFVRDAVIKCAAVGEESSRRTILLLDEYETLFEQLKNETKRHPASKYDIAIPLLDQLADFASSNLLVLVGQRPDAHYVLMDQNPLSPLVEQDQFPLFEHSQGSRDSEFALLIDRILGTNLEWNNDFADAVYAETSGHPYLTVNLLTTLVDWLIREQFPPSHVHLSAGLFGRFAGEELVPKRIAANSDFELFHNYFHEGLGQTGRTSYPWVHLVYVLLRAIARESPRTMRLSKDDATAVLEKAGATDLDLNPDSVLRNAALANFLSIDETGTASPRIPLMCRIAGTVRAGVN